MNSGGLIYAFCIIEHVILYRYHQLTVLDSWMVELTWCTLCILAGKCMYSYVVMVAVNIYIYIYSQYVLSARPRLVYMQVANPPKKMSHTLYTLIDHWYT